jgi:DNA-binding NarL/FixJ family response regulator
MIRHQGADDASAGSVNYKVRETSAREPSDHNRQPFRDVPDAVISFAVIDEILFTCESIINLLLSDIANSNVASFTTVDECLQSNKSYDLVLYHVHQYPMHINDDRLICLEKLTQIAPVIILSAADFSKTITKAFDSGVHGYIPTTSTGVALAIEIIRFVLAGGTFVPRSGLSLRGNNQRGATPWAIEIPGLTPRQLEVLDHLKLGKANKTIAHELGVSESTVKVHIRGIMKKMRATNRTEVACRAYGFATHLAQRALAMFMFGWVQFGS